MNISIFDVTGPVMVGPSSSHTAGAARLARVARLIAARPFVRVSFGLHGSFARTGKGHGTDRALVAGALGIRGDDDRLAQSFEIASECGLEYEFYDVELDDVHENSALITFYFADGGQCEIVGSSVGGGRIIIRRIDDYEVELDAVLPTILISQQDVRGVLSAVSHVLADAGLNIGVMRLSRQIESGKAFCVIETDGDVDDRVVQRLRDTRGVFSVRAFNPEG